MFDDLEIAIEAARAGGDIVRNYYENGCEVGEKTAGDPVTAADLEADAEIKKICLAAFPLDGWLSEETRDSAERLSKSRVWIVDPLDGTREFVDHIPEFCVCVALCVDGAVEAAVSYNPISDELFSARRGAGVRLNDEPVHCSRQQRLEQALLLASRSESRRGEWRRYQDHVKVKETGSVAYKLASVAAGLGDATFTLKPKNEWDVCSGALLIEEGGGVISDTRGRPLSFNRQDTLFPGIIAAPSALWGPIYDLIKAEEKE